MAGAAWPLNLRTESISSTPSDQIAEPPSAEVGAVAQRPLGQLLRHQRAIASDEPARLGEPPMRGDEVRSCDAIAVQKDAIGSPRRHDRPVARPRGAKAAILLKDMGQRERRAGGPIGDQRGGVRAGAVIGDHDVEIPVALARKRAQHRIERGHPIIGRHDD